MFFHCRFILFINVLIAYKLNPPPGGRSKAELNRKVNFLIKVEDNMNMTVQSLNGMREKR
ncbi:hypothetical protein AVJ24_13210 [Yersinia pestis]|nr:hypothetical protein AVJ24_13210 [Yersinia pestis]